MAVTNNQGKVYVLGAQGDSVAGQMFIQGFTVSGTGSGAVLVTESSGTSKPLFNGAISANSTISLMFSEKVPVSGVYAQTLPTGTVITVYVA